MPRLSASRRRLAYVASDDGESHSTLSGTAARMRIQTSNIGGTILYALLKQQNTIASFRQALLRAGLRSRIDGAPRVAGRVPVGEIQEALGEVRLHLGRRRESVGDDVVEPIRAERSQEAQPVHLQGSRPRHEDLRPRAQRVAVQVDQDLDAVGADALHRRLRGVVAGVDEMLERVLDAPAQRAVLVRPDRVGEYVEAAAVVPLPELGEQVGDRVQAEVAGYVPDLEARPARRRAQRFRVAASARAIGRREALRDRQLLRRRQRQSERVQGNQRVRGALRQSRDVFVNFVERRRPIGPVADELPRGQERVGHVSRGRLFPQRDQMAYRLRAPAELDQQRRQGEFHGGVLGRELQRLAVALFGSEQRAELVLADAEVRPDLRRCLCHQVHVGLVMEGAARENPVAAAAVARDSRGLRPARRARPAPVRSAPWPRRCRRTPRARARGC